jgi:hypothetical protein
MRHIAILFPALILGMAAPGCGTSASVSGQVTYEGAAVKKGLITFLPADGNGPAAAGPITDGSYRVDNLTPGPKVVQIVSTEDTTAPVVDLEEVRKKKGKGPAPSSALIPANAVGNNTGVEIKAGAQTLSFDLKKPHVSP